ncbi:Hypothetical protein A7982_04955 [Minicystis rosea]|nr:Hypothetical protein A7982_04955 [Minicystis rosea]
MNEARLEIAQWLLASGAGASARNVLGTMRGAPANRLRLRAEDAVLRPGIYALVSIGDGLGAAVPLQPSPGRSRAADPVFRAACDRALEAARAFLRAPSLPALRFDFEEWISISGSSIGLPAALAFVAHYAPRRAPLSAILATGALGDGGIERVGHMPEKLSIAAAEREVGCLLLPADEPLARGADRAATLAEAFAIVFGDGPVAPDVRHLHVDAVLQRVHADRDSHRGIDLLSALPRDALAPADRARVLLELGSLHRHIGQSSEAARLHAEARVLLDEERAVIGAEAAERYELECWATALDDFRIEETIAALRARLASPFLKLRNELRCRGMLAQAVGMSGRFGEAARIRAENLPIHARSDALRKVAPATHGYIALDAARAGDAATFAEQTRAMGLSTRPGDEVQERFNAAVIVRGLVALGRCAGALAWANDEARIFDLRVPSSLARLLRSRALIDTHPEVSLARALCRALRRTGQPGPALALADRVPASDHTGPGLAGWHAQLVRLEGALALADAGDRDAAAARIVAARTGLGRAHAAATRHHADLLDTEDEALEAAIDRVWY